MWEQILYQINTYDFVWTDWLANIGVALLLVTLYLNVEGKINSKGFIYNFNNLVVAVLLTINLIYHPNLSTLIIEFFWAAISLKGLYNYYKNN
jgi:hypothetical protein